jgi:hypothetical protein
MHCTSQRPGAWAGGAQTDPLSHQALGRQPHTHPPLSPPQTDPHTPYHSTSKLYERQPEPRGRDDCSPARGGAGRGATGSLAPPFRGGIGCRCDFAKTCGHGLPTWPRPPLGAGPVVPVCRPGVPRGLLLRILLVAQVYVLPVELCPPVPTQVGRVGTDWEAVQPRHGIGCRPPARPSPILPPPILSAPARMAL